MPRVKLDPLGCQHEVDMTVILESPIFKNFSQIKLRNHLMGSYQSVHVSSQAQLSVYRFLVEFYFDERVRVRADNEIHFRPVYHYYFFDVVHYIR